jgi:hypothetical protein
MLLAPGSRLIAADIVLQRAVVRKYTSRPWRRFRVTAGLTLPRHAFLPPPQVDSAVLVIRSRTAADGPRDRRRLARAGRGERLAADVGLAAMRRRPLLTVRDQVWTVR